MGKGGEKGEKRDQLLEWGISLGIPVFFFAKKIFWFFIFFFSNV